MGLAPLPPTVPQSFEIMHAAPQQDPWDIEGRKDGSIIVRMHSNNRRGEPLPDAVFTFRVGDPQYDYWKQQLDASAKRPARRSH
jgi:hypothetical protein